MKPSEKAEGLEQAIKDIFGFDRRDLIRQGERRTTMKALFDAEAFEQANTITPESVLLAAAKQVLGWIDAGCDPSVKSIENLRLAIAAVERAKR